jgi:hypothetical protein
MKIASPNLADAVMMLQMPIDIYEDYDEEYEPDRTGEGWA